MVEPESAPPKPEQDKPEPKSAEEAKTEAPSQDAVDPAEPTTPTPQEQPSAGQWFSSYLGGVTELGGDWVNKAKEQVRFALFVLLALFLSLDTISQSYWM